MNQTLTSHLKRVTPAVVVLIVVILLIPRAAARSQNQNLNLKIKREEKDENIEFRVLTSGMGKTSHQKKKENELSVIFLSIGQDEFALCHVFGISLKHHQVQTRIRKFLCVLEKQMGFQVLNFCKECFLYPRAILRKFGTNVLMQINYWGLSSMLMYATFIIGAILWIFTFRVSKMFSKLS